MLVGIRQNASQLDDPDPVSYYIGMHLSGHEWIARFEASIQLAVLLLCLIHMLAV